MKKIFSLIILLLVLAAPKSSFANSELIVHLSDTHFSPNPTHRNNLQFKKLVEDINQVIKPDLVIHSGDIADFADDLTVYQNFFSEWNKIKAKKLYVSGNHDYIKSDWSGSWVFHNSPYNFPQAVQLGNFYFIGVPYNNYNPQFQPGGWAEQKAKEAQRLGKIPIFIMHYPLVKPDASPWSQMSPAKYLLRSPFDQQLKELIQRYHSPLYLSGHIHTPYRMRKILSNQVFEQLVAGFPSGSSYYQNFALLVIDQNKIFSSPQKLNRWPAIIITSPNWYDPQSRTGEINTNPLIIRTKIIGRSSQDQYQVRYQLGQQTGELFYNQEDGFWQSQPIDLTPWANKEIDLSVEASDLNPSLYEEDETFQNQTKIRIKIAQNLLPLPTPTLQPILPTPTPTPTIQPTPTPQPSPTPTPTPQPTTKELTVQVAAAPDDNFQLYGERDGNPLVINLGYVYQAIFRFPNLPIPPKAKILDARLKLAPAWYQAKTGTLPIFGDKSPQSQPADQQNIASRTLTSNSVNWEISTPWPSRRYQSSPDLAPIIQEIVNQPGWDPQNNALSLIVKENYYLHPGERIYWSVYSYEKDPRLAAKLFIRYLTTTQPTPTPTPNPTPTPPPQNQTIRLKINSASDDHYQVYYSSGSGGNTGLNDRITAGRKTSWQSYQAAFRFKDTALPQNAKIRSAELKLFSRWWQQKQGGLKIGVEDPADPNLEKPLDKILIKERRILPKTVSWQIQGEWPSLQPKKVDITSLIQQAVNSPSWNQENDDLVVILKENSLAYWSFVSFEFSPNKTAQLTIEYTY